MPCYHPVTMFYSRTVNASGKRSLVKDWNKALGGHLAKPQLVPCQQCIGCRLEKSRQWAVRMMHEASLHDDNCFLTLTFDEAHLPADGSLCLRTLQNFMKRVRKRFPHLRLKSFQCGEYGGDLGRPHYHLIVFGLDFEDKYFWRFSDTGEKLYRSETLEKLWTFGHCEIGDVTFESCAYVARYVCKKVTGPMAEAHYGGLKPEFATMSRGRRGGIAKDWFERYSADVYPHDNVIVRGRPSRPPRFYDKLLEKENFPLYEMLKHNRAFLASIFVDNNTPERLYVREEVKLAQVQSLKRKLV